MHVTVCSYTLNLCTSEWDLPGMESDSNNEWYSVQPRELSDHLAILGAEMPTGYEKKLGKIGNLSR